MEADLSSSSISNNDQEELLKSAKVKMDEVREENEKLKKLLAQILKEYHTLEKQIPSMNRSNKGSPKLENSIECHKIDEEEEEEETIQERDLISLSLGNNWSSEKRKINDENDNKNETINNNSLEKRRKIEEGLELGLDCRFETYVKDVVSDSLNESNVDTTNEVKKEDDSIATWPPSRDLIKAKEIVNNIKDKDEDHNSHHQPQVKKTRVCIRSRCDSPTIHDGCQWRKYGQKIAKGNPCPRAYYRCTVSSNCPVRKQVQRCPQDMSILITTYEGTHNHPLPLSATAMASATSAAAAMLKTGSLTSQSSLNTSNLPTTSSYGPHASNLITTFNNNPSMITAASHNSHPTVTLDLTTANPDFSLFNWPFSSNSSSSTSSRNSSSFLNFSSSPSSLPSLDFASNGSATRANNNAYMNNSYATLFHNNSSNINNNEISKTIFQSLNSHNQVLNETIAAAATKAIASNPNLQSVLEAAISTYVGNNNNNNNNSNNNDHKKSSLFPWSGNNNNSQSNNESGSLNLFPTPLKNNSNGTKETRDNNST